MPVIVPMLDIRSIGAGGGSIAWVDDGGLLRVGPQSAGSTPGPVSYGKGGAEPTVTDCSLILGYIDPDFFLGGTMVLDRAAAATALKTKVADKLGLSVEEAAAAVFTLATEKMVGAIDEITVNQGIDPATAVLIGGGGAAGLNAVAVGRRLGCAGVLIPEAGSVLSAAGALMSFADRLQQAWYEGHPALALLGPLEAIYRRVVIAKRNRFLKGTADSYRASVPVVVVGNITVGGTGKPLSSYG